MRVLVTGGAGFIGSHVADAYVAAGHQVAIVDNLSSGRMANVPTRVTFYEVDILDPALEAIFAEERPQVVNHHAAQVDVRRSVSDPLFDAQVNILGSAKLIEHAVKSGVEKFVYISSGGAVYGEPEYLPCDEDHPVHPLSPYGASKHAVEHYLYLARHNHGLDYTVLRYGNVYGPRQDPNGEAGVVAIFTGRMLKGEPVTIFGTGEQTRDFVYVGDCVRANLLALTKGSGGIYNVGCGVETSINQIFDSLKAHTAYPHEPIYAPAKAGETFRIYLDAARASQELGWKPETTLEDGLLATVEHFSP